MNISDQSALCCNHYLMSYGDAVGCLCIASWCQFKNSWWSQAKVCQQISKGLSRTRQPSFLAFDGHEGALPETSISIRIHICKQTGQLWTDTDNPEVGHTVAVEHASATAMSDGSRPYLSAACAERGGDRKCVFVAHMLIHIQDDAHWYQRQFLSHS